VLREGSTACRSSALTRIAGLKRGDRGAGRLSMAIANCVGRFGRPRALYTANWSAVFIVSLARRPAGFQIGRGRQALFIVLVRGDG